MRSGTAGRLLASVASIAGRLPVPPLEGVPEVIILARCGLRLGLGDGLFIVCFFFGIVIIEARSDSMTRCGCFFTSLDHIVIVVRDIDISRCPLFKFLFFVVVIKRREQARSEAIVVIIARHLQPGNRLAILSGGDRTSDSFFRICGWRSLLDRVPFGRGGDADLLLNFDHCLTRGTLRGRSWGQRAEIEPVQIVGVSNRTSRRKVNSEKLLCQRLGRRLVAGTWRIRLVHNNKSYPFHP
jgi:hypothetical protein